MKTTDYITIGLLALGFVIFNALLVWFVMKRGRDSGGQESQREQDHADAQADIQAQRMQDGFGFLQKELQEMRQTFDAKIGESTKETSASVRAQLSESQKMMAIVTQQL